LYELRVQGLESRFFGGGKTQKEKEKEAGSDSDQEEEDEIIEAGEGEQENSFLNSANLCRCVFCSCVELL